MGTFQEDFAPAKYDIVYGKQKAREIYVERFMSAEQRGFVKADQGFMDDYNARFGLDDYGNFKGEDPKKVVHDVVTGGEDDDDAPPGAKAMSEGLLKSRFSPAGVFDPKTRGTDARLQRETKDVKVSDGKPPSAEQQKAQARMSLALRRSCKFGIAFVATNADFLKAGARLRFVLDGLDLQAAAAKTEITREVTRDEVGKVNSTFVPVTTSELRYICRHWDELKPVVFFYLNGDGVAAPWESDWTGTDCFGAQRASKTKPWLEYLAERKNKKTRHEKLLG
jgi:hypothetical protein